MLSNLLFFIGGCCLGFFVAAVMMVGSKGG